MIQRLTSLLVELARKRAHELTIEESREILALEWKVKAEADRITRIEIPELIKYLDYLYPKQELIGFEKFLRGRNVK